MGKTTTATTYAGNDNMEWISAWMTRVNAANPTDMGYVGEFDENGAGGIAWRCELPDAADAEGAPAVGSVIRLELRWKAGGEHLDGLAENVMEGNIHNLINDKLELELPEEIDEALDIAYDWAGAFEQSPGERRYGKVFMATTDEAAIALASGEFMEWIAGALGEGARACRIHIRG